MPDPLTDAGLSYESVLRKALQTIARPSCVREGRLLDRGYPCSRQWPLVLDKWCEGCLARAAIEYFASMDFGATKTFARNNADAALRHRAEGLLAAVNVGTTEKQLIRDLLAAVDQIQPGAAQLLEELEGARHETRQWVDEHLKWRRRAEAAERQLQALQQAVGKWQRRCDRGYDPEEEPTTTEYWLGVRAVVDELASFAQLGAKLEGPASGAPAAATMSATESTGILALIKKWRADADFNPRETSPGYSHGLRKCADELLATLTQPGAAQKE